MLLSGIKSLKIDVIIYETLKKIIIFCGLSIYQSISVFCDCVYSIVWIYHLAAYETYREKAKLELYMNATYCFKRILKATLHKTAGIRSLNSHLTNHPSKTRQC